MRWQGHLEEKIGNNSLKLSMGVKSKVLNWSYLIQRVEEDIPVHGKKEGVQVNIRVAQVETGTDVPLEFTWQVNSTTKTRGSHV
jgi:hypothetical protein